MQQNDQRLTQAGLPGDTLQSSYGISFQQMHNLHMPNYNHSSPEMLQLIPFTALHSSSRARVGGTLPTAPSLPLFVALPLPPLDLLV
jgi:hypothetical protein